MATPNPLQLLGFGKKGAATASAPNPPQPAPSAQAAPWAESPAPAAEEQAPLLSVVKGNPTDEELAALTSVLVALQAQADSQQETALEMWQRRLNRTQLLGMKLRPGHGSWKRARPQ
ncbi:acyl-CoA carboxylase epsilon subunit [Rothia nasimurium]|uniref:acyl-CoA carboxylase subunit epsilon n=1 Tax=Rothia nasimurium TaxID=85336 RepID=UPI003B9EF10D